jgi:hypothetical protein
VKKLETQILEQENTINPFDSPGFAVLIREANEGGLKPGGCSGLILSGAFYPDLKIGVWRRERIKDKQAEITLLEIQKTKSRAQIASEEVKLKISEEYLRNISLELTLAKARTDALEEQLKKSIEGQQKGNDAISLGLLLYSSQVQSHFQYYGALGEKLNTEKVLQENSRLNIKSKAEDRKESDARIGILKNDVDNIGNTIKLILERKARIRYAEIIKDPVALAYPFSQRKAMYFLWGALIGLAVFSLAALFLERCDQYRSRT